MAKSVTKRKKKAGARRGAKGIQAPSFEGWENLAIEKFHSLKRSVSDFYYMEFKPSDNIEHIFTWMKENGYNKADISSAKKAAKFEGLTGIYCRMLLDGCPDFVQAEDDYWQTLPGTGGNIHPITDYIKPKVADLIERGKSIVEEKKVEDKAKKNVYVPSIQERIKDQALLACEDIEEWLDTFINDKDAFDPNGFNFAKHFLKHKVTQAHARKIKGLYTSELEEAYLIQKLPTPGEINRCKDEREADQLQQLREGYGHLTKKDASAYLKALETLHGACDVVIDAAKANRKPRKRVAPSKDKMVSKVKYLERDDKLQLVSVNPLDLIEAQEVWVYNVKTRKLGKYIAEDHATIQVKGTTLLHFNELQSKQKTLRKPAETLRDFKNAGKVQLRKFMDDIKTTDIKLTGRLNSDTIILKCTR